MNAAVLEVQGPRLSLTCAGRQHDAGAEPIRTEKRSGFAEALSLQKAAV